MGCTRRTPAARLGTRARVGVDKRHDKHAGGTTVNSTPKVGETARFVENWEGLTLGRIPECRFSLFGVGLRQQF
ncbi:hypothetical protein HMPREF0290_2295 [Corynebacterium efficiens YS-314]|uniref:Uncharacterized protein n=1 Tax=Corynebacterium efficiens (strain DSM 44549 / YS-314 / AJ 12310 / JCM 11189 / NBRC 100395) TaxID=196164 RepID=Q8FN91_COREF|nr:hypothetical protein HMPREF0290_2295 [Corynebacterium efficiens YS-314]BAC19066.1 hypothetical protein [Corynebacterium efficiens YS-314]